MNLLRKCYEFRKERKTNKYTIKKAIIEDCKKTFKFRLSP